MSNPWEETKAWKTESDYYNWLRGQLRQLWSDYPVRTEFKDEVCREVTKEERASKTFHPSTKKVGQCVFCEEWFPKSKLEVDHKIASAGCKSKEEVEKFLWYCGGALKDDMQLSCKPCHKIKTYAERYGMTFEAAIIEKQVIAFGNLPLQEQKDLFSNKGYEIPSNADKRKDEYRNLLTGGKL